MIELKSKSNSGSTIYIERVFFEIASPKTYASYVLLKNYYADRDETNIKSYAYRMRKIAFSRNYLTKVLNEKGCLTCSYCNKSNLIIELDGMKVPNNKKATIDHIEAISKGGAVFDEKNITVACGKCNSKKGDKPVEEFINKFVNLK
jgi:5-methylcytosine-specific restriction endonuclease McrA